MIQAQGLFINGERPEEQPLGLRVPVCVFEQLGQVLEADCHVGMIRAKAVFINGERPAE
jgi:hypothetical protein